MAEPMAPAPIIAMLTVLAGVLMFTSSCPAIHISFSMQSGSHNRVADLAVIATGAETSWQPVHGRFYVGSVLMHLVWAVGTSGTNAICETATKPNWCEKCDVQALDLSSRA